MTIEIRNVRTDQYADYVRAIGTGFLDRSDADLVAEQGHVFRLNGSTAEEQYRMDQQESQGTRY